MSFPSALPCPLPLSCLHPAPLVEEGAQPVTATLLLLHGFTQSASVMREKMHALARRLKAAGIRLVFANAPYHVPPEFCGDRADARAWWWYHPLDDGVPQGEEAGIPRFQRAYQGWNASRSYLAALWQSHGPFNAVLGFSQGAVVCHQLLREMEAWGNGGSAPGLAPPEVAASSALLMAPPAAVVMVCGFPARHGPELPPPVDGEGRALRPEDAGWLLPVHRAEARVRTPALVVIGAGDTLVPPQLQRELAASLGAATVRENEHGHALPQRSADCAVVVDFIVKHVAAARAAQAAGPVPPRAQIGQQCPHPGALQAMLRGMEPELHTNG